MTPSDSSRGMRAMLEAAGADAYRVTDADPSALSFTDGEWDGDGARARMPNPSDEDTDLSDLDGAFVFVPEGEDARDQKSNWVCPFRTDVDAPAHVSGLIACLAAINGARGGITGIETDTLRSGYDFVVDALVAAGHYDDRDEAPDFEAEAAVAADGGFEPGGELDDGVPYFPTREAAEQAAEMTDGPCSGAHEMEVDGSTVYVPCGAHDEAVDAFASKARAAYTFEVGDTATWAEDSDNQAYGVIRDRTDSGSDNFAERIDGDFALDATEDNPAYLLEILQEREDGWVPTGTMVGHREETLSSWTPDGGVMEAAMVRAAGSTAVSTGDLSDSALAAADADGSDPLMGVIWGAGNHDLSLGGSGAKVHVPEDTIPPTFDQLQDDVAAGDVTLGFDHPGGDSVAAKTGIVDIGRADDVALTEDGKNIVMTDSTLTNDRAAEAAASGDFDALDWSVVADVRIQRGDDGEPVHTDDGRVVIAATRIRRVDAVNDGAVDAASIERSRDALPSLKSAVEAAERAAGDLTSDHVTEAVAALKAAASDLRDTDTTMSTTINGDDYDDPEAALQAAADVIDNQEERLTALSGAFEAVVEAADVESTVDPTEDPEAAAQTVIDAHTADLRREIAEMEANLAKHDVEDVEKRAEALAGKTAGDLRDLRNKRAYEKMKATERKATASAAVADKDTTGRVTASGGDDVDTEAVARKAMDGGDVIKAKASDLSPAEYLRQKYGVEPRDYDNTDDLRAAVTAAATGGE